MTTNPTISHLDCRQHSHVSSVYAICSLIYSACNRVSWWLALFSRVFFCLLRRKTQRTVGTRFEWSLIATVASRRAHPEGITNTPAPRPRTHTHTGIKREYNTLQSTRGSGNVRAQRQMLKFNLILSVIYFSSPVVRRWPRWRSVCVCAGRVKWWVLWRRRRTSPVMLLACKRACFCVPLGWRRCVASAILCVFNTHVHVRVYCKCCFFSLPFCLHSFTAVMYRTATNNHASTILLLCVSTLKTIPLNNARHFFWRVLGGGEALV